MLSRLAGALRLRQQLLSKTRIVSEGTARHGLNDHHDIGHERHTALVRRLVDGLFSEDYLTAQGLNRVEAAHHNELVVLALDASLANWDQVAIFANVAPEDFSRLHDLLGDEVGMSVDVFLRLAALRRPLRRPPSLHRPGILMVEGAPAWGLVDWSGEACSHTHPGE